jgi:hypothetical protein
VPGAVLRGRTGFESSSTFSLVTHSIPPTPRHECSAKVEFCLVLVVCPTSQPDVGRFMLVASRPRNEVVELNELSGSAAPPIARRVGASAGVARPDGTPDVRRDVAGWGCGSRGGGFRGRGLSWACEAFSHETSSRSRPSACAPSRGVRKRSITGVLPPHDLAM